MFMLFPIIGTGLFIYSLAGIMLGTTSVYTSSYGLSVAILLLSPGSLAEIKDFNTEKSVVKILIMITSLFFTISLIYILYVGLFGSLKEYDVLLFVSSFISQCPYLYFMYSMYWK